MKDRNEMREERFRLNLPMSMRILDDVLDDMIARNLTRARTAILATEIGHLGFEEQSTAVFDFMEMLREHGYSCTAMQDEGIWLGDGSQTKHKCWGIYMCADDNVMPEVTRELYNYTPYTLDKPFSMGLGEMTQQLKEYVRISGELSLEKEKVEMLVEKYRELKGCEPDEDCDNCRIASLNNGLSKYAQVCAGQEYSK